MSCGVVGDFLGGMDSPPTSRGQAFLGNDDIKSGDDGGGRSGCSVVGSGFAFWSVCWVLGGRWKVRDSHAGFLWHLRRRLWHRRLSCHSLHACLWETCRCRGRGLCAGPSVLRINARPLCGTAFDSEPSRGNVGVLRWRQLWTPRRGSRALIPVTPGRTDSRASQCQRHRRPKIGSTDSAGPLEEGVPLRADGPSIAWMDGEGARDP